MAVESTAHGESHPSLNSTGPLGSSPPCAQLSASNASRPPNLPCKPASFRQHRHKVSSEDQTISTAVSVEEKSGLQLSSSDYNLPADAVLPSGPVPLGKKGESPQTRKISFNVSSCPGEGHYSDVFDKIQSDQVHVIGTPTQPSAVLPRSSETKGSSDLCCPKVQTRKNGAVVTDGSRTLPRLGNPSSSPSNGATLDLESGIGERRMSLPQSRLPASAKELVELDPRKKIFRMESQRRRNSPAVGEPTVDGSEYSAVNMADKLKYRTNDGSAKSEGSGAPVHYSPDVCTAQDVIA